MLLAISMLPDDSRWAALGAVVAFFILLGLCGAKFSSLLIGEDERTSTSKFQALLWTVVLAWALLALTFQGKSDFNIVPDYLALLGFPALALIFAKSIVQQKLEQGDIAKPPPASSDPAKEPAEKVEEAQAQLQRAKVQVSSAAETDDPSLATSAASQATEQAAKAIESVGQAITAKETPSRSFFSYLGDIVNNDSGRPDIADLQYVVFNLIAATYFFINFFTHNALPEIPDTLIALTGASSATYVGNKLMLKQTPVLTAVTPPMAPPHAQITLRGSNLAGSGANPDGSAAVTQLKFGTTAKGPLLVSDSGVTVEVPDNVEGFIAGTPKDVQITVVNAAGLESNPLAFTISG